MEKVTLTILKKKQKWVIKNSVKVSLPVTVYHNFRKNQSENLKQLTLQKTLPKKLVPKPNRIKLMNANRKRVLRRRIRKAINIQAAERRAQNSLIRNPNIAIGIVSLLQPNAIASILRQNNVEIPLSSLNNPNNFVSNTNVDINNNSRDEVSSLQSSMIPRDNGNADNVVNVDNITESNQSETLHVEEEIIERGVKAINMETQTDNVIEDSVSTNKKPVDKPDKFVPRQVPTVPTVDNAHRDCPFQESIQSLSQLNDWNSFLQQTHMGQTHKDWFDPNAGKKNKAPVRNKHRQRRNKEVMRYDPDMLLTHHMMVNKTAGMSGSDSALYRGTRASISGFASSEVPMSYGPIVPSMLMAPGYNTSSSQRLDPAYRFNNSIQVRSQNSSDLGRTNANTRFRLPLPALRPYRPSATSTVTSGTLQGNASTSRWQVPFETQTDSTHQSVEEQIQQRTNTLRAHRQSTRTIYTDLMTKNTFIDDPRRRSKK